MGESNTAVKDSPQTTGQTPETPKASTSTQPITTYTEEQVKEREKKAISDALAEQGRKHKIELETAITKERASLADHLKETKDKIAQLEIDLDEMSQDDPDKKNLVRKIRALEEAEGSLKAERKTLDDAKTAHEAEKTSYQEEIARAKATNFEIDVWNVAEDFEGGDAVKLKNACDKAKIITIEGARDLASVLWTKKSEKNPEPLTSGPPDSGATSGGSHDWKAIMEEYNKKPNDPQVKEAYLKARRQRGI